MLPSGVYDLPVRGTFMAVLGRGAYIILPMMHTICILVYVTSELYLRGTLIYLRIFK